MLEGKKHDYAKLGELRQHAAWLESVGEDVVQERARIARIAGVLDAREQQAAGAEAARREQEQRERERADRKADRGRRLYNAALEWGRNQIVGKGFMPPEVVLASAEEAGVDMDAAERALSDLGIFELSCVPMQIGPAGFYGVRGSVRLQAYAGARVG